MLTGEFCSFSRFQIGSSVKETKQKEGQQCGMYVLLEEVGIFMMFFVLIGEMRLGNVFFFFFSKPTKYSSALRGLLIPIVLAVLSYRGSKGITSSSPHSPHRQSLRCTYYFLT